MNRVRPDSPALGAVAVILACVVAIASFAVSFSGLIATAQWAGVPAFLRPAVPIVIDSSLLVFTVSALVAQGRGEDARLAWGAVFMFTGVSVVTNTAHALNEGAGFGTSTFAALVGAGIAGLMPVACLAATHTVVNLIVLPPEGSQAARRKRERARHMPSNTAPSSAEQSPQERSIAAARNKAHAPAVTVSVKEVRLLAGTGLSQREIATQLGTSKSTVGRLLRQDENQPSQIVS